MVWTVRRIFTNLYRFCDANPVWKACARSALESFDNKDPRERAHVCVARVRVKFFFLGRRKRVKCDMIV